MATATNYAAFNTENYWVNNSGASTNERLDSVTTDSGVVLVGLLGTRTISANEYAFESGGYTYRYHGSWTYVATANLITSTVSGSGSYNQITVEDAQGHIVSNWVGDSRSVDFGTRSGLAVLNLVGDVVTLVSDLLFGASSAAYVNLHKDAHTSPSLTDLAYSASDTIIGSTGADTLVGHSGNDTIYFDGLDTIDGGDGFDFATAFYSATGVTVYTSFSHLEGVYGSAFNDDINAGSQTTGGQFYGYDGNDIIRGSAFSDYIHGGNGDDLLYIDGSDTVIGGAGRDTADATFSNSAINIDTAATTVEVVKGSHFNDTINGTNQTVRGDFYGNDGDDTIYGTAYADLLDGGAGNDLIYFDATDTLLGGSGFDFATAYYAPAAINIDTFMTGIEGVYGSRFNDVINAGAQTSGGSYFGYDGNDIITASDYSDIVNGGNGTDIVAYNGLSTEYSWSFANDLWTVTRIGTQDVDTLVAVETLRFYNGDFALT